MPVVQRYRRSVPCAKAVPAVFHSTPPAVSGRLAEGAVAGRDGAKTDGLRSPSAESRAWSGPPPRHQKYRALPFVSRQVLSLIHISEPTRQAEISYAVF